jgi:hypothetical protein
MMDPASEFRRHADECRRMAGATLDPQDRETWSRLAERWLRCADYADYETRTAQSASRARAATPRRTGRIAGRPQQAA